MGLFSSSTGTVGATPQEQMLASTAMAQWNDYQTRWLPLQDHFSSVVSDMGNPNSWQRQEAEGKGNEDVAAEYARQNQQRTTSELDHGINVGSARFKLGAAGAASSEASAKGMAINTGNEAIDKAYLANLGAVTRAGQGLAGASVQGMGVGAETASRMGISLAQENSATTAATMGSLGYGLGVGVQGLMRPGGGGGGGGDNGGQQPSDPGLGPG